MATVTKTKLKNFIGGEAVDPVEGGSEEVVNPATGEVIAEAPLSTKEDVDRAVAAAEQGLRGRQLVDHPAERKGSGAAAHGRPDRRARRGDRRPRVRRRGQAASRGDGGRSPGDGGPAALLRRRRPLPGGSRRGRVHGGPHLLHPARADRRGRPDHPLELPDDDDDLEDRPGAGGRQHDRPQAGRDDAGDDAEVRRVVRRHPAARRLQRDRRPRPAGRLGAGHPPRRADGQPDRVAGHRQVDRPGRGGVAEAGPPRARRQGPGSRLRRRRHGDGDGDDRRHRLLQRRPGLHRGDPRPRLQERLRRRRQRARRAKPRDSSSATRCRPTPRSARSTPRASAKGSRASSSASRTTPRSSPAAPSPTCPATSSSRRSSPASSRATR